MKSASAQPKSNRKYPASSIRHPSSNGSLRPHSSIVLDGFVTIGGCDKNIPGSLMAIARLNRPAVFVYGGTILPGCITGDNRKLDIVSVFEAVGAHANKQIDAQQLQAIESCAIPGPGS